MMDLTESIFLHSGEYTSFTVFADYPCHVRYVKSVAVPPGEDSVDFYAIDPAPYSRWVVVQRRQGERRHLMFYIRTGNAFPEKPPNLIPGRLKREILLRILSLKEPPTGGLIQRLSASSIRFFAGFPQFRGLRLRFNLRPLLPPAKQGSPAERDFPPASLMPHIPVSSDSRNVGAPPRHWAQQNRGRPSRFPVSLSNTVRRFIPMK
jgi:hypothetical protein